jgi:hypothetical protein
MKTKRSKTYQPNDFLPLKWKIKRHQPPQTLEQTGILMVGTLPPWMNRD